MPVAGQEVRGKRADHVAVACPHLAEQVASGPIGDLVELAPEHGDAGFGVDAGGADVLVAEKLLDVVMCMPSASRRAAMVWRRRWG